MDTQVAEITQFILGRTLRIDRIETRFDRIERRFDLVTSPIG
jgi:hypothetical protein